MSSTEIAASRQAPAPPTAARLAWLDALRGIAALFVVFEHAMAPLLPEVHRAVVQWFSPGWFGVVVFFLVSGYVIPASLERRGDLRAFWIGRIFRLHPLFLVSAAAALLLVAAGIAPLNPQLADQPVQGAFAHLVMLNDVLGVPSLVGVFWTLSYEMIFYLLVTAFYVCGVHRHSASMAIAFATGAVILGGVLPRAWLSGTSPNLTVAVAVVVVGLGITSVCRGSVRSGALLLGGLALTLLLVNQRKHPWEGLIILGTMFAGTAAYRIEQRQLPRRMMALLAVVPVLAVTAILRFSAEWVNPAYLTPYRRNYAIAIIAAWLTFGVGWLCRNKRLPAVLTGLGLISYSLYLLHHIPVQIARKVLAGSPLPPLGNRLCYTAALMLLSCGLAMLTYRYVERPMQRLGRRYSKARTDRLTTIG